MKKMLLALAVSAFAYLGAQAQVVKLPEGTIKFWVERPTYEGAANVTITTTNLWILPQQNNYPTTGALGMYEKKVVSTTGYTGFLTDVYYWVPAVGANDLGLVTSGSVSIKNTGAARTLYVRVGIWKSNAGGSYVSWANSEPAFVGTNGTFTFTTPLNSQPVNPANWPVSAGADAPTGVFVEVMQN